jgi:alkylhydroperoxidase family enzyme
MRKGLTESHERAWAAIAAPGTWLTGARRVAVAAEVRHAQGCAQCARLKAALSPDIAGEHDTPGGLSAAEVELVHRVASDPGRLTQAWARSVLARGLPEGEYVEIVGIIAMVMMIDTFHRALDLPERALPAPQPGEPTRYTPPGAKKQAAWLALVEPEDAVAADGPMYPHPRVGYIYRALSLVPQSVRDYWALAFEHYLPSEFVYKFDQSIRAITRPQTEVLAARVSALHQCAY